MTTLRLGELVLIRMQFHQAPGSKVRPALVLLDTGDDDFVAAPITSQPRLSEYDLTIKDWRAAGLNVVSSVRVHKLAHVNQRRTGRRLLQQRCIGFSQASLRLGVLA
ncbi:MAG: type II toxin-antitoxin system PemK/MazF family toxin [Acidobacteria bacterium]|nr:type II toxin-antitoxin system PemK/MazF family toxin [Acidobacteriota bacterium]